MTNKPLSNERYTSVAILLHWTIALLIIGMLIAGWVMTSMDKHNPIRSEIFSLHKSFGILTLLLIAVRILWKITHRPPAWPSHMARWQQIVATATHHALYVAMVVMPGLGLIHSLYGKYGTRFFGVTVPTPFTPDKALSHDYAEWHGDFAWVLVAILAVHLCGVIYHRVVKKDGMTKRMLPACCKKS